MTVGAKTLTQVIGRHRGGGKLWVFQGTTSDHTATASTHIVIVVAIASVFEVVLYEVNDEFTLQST